MADETNTPAPDPVAERLAKLEADHAAAIKRAEDAEKAAAAAAARVDALTGHVMTSMRPTAPAPEPEPEPDFSMEPQKAVEYYFQKKTAPLVAEQLRREAEREKIATVTRAGEDWKEYGNAVEDLIKQNRIAPEVLAQPGSYDQLLQFVKAKDLDNIVQRKVQAEMAAKAADQAKTAATAAPSGVNRGAEGKPAPEPTDAEMTIFRKLGVDPKKAVEASNNTTYDGVRIRGEVAV